VPYTHGVQKMRLLTNNSLCLKNGTKFQRKMNRKSYTLCCSDRWHYRWP